MSNQAIFYSIRDFKDGYRGYWLSECPDSPVWKHGFYWDGVGAHHATQYSSFIQAKEAAQHFINRDALKEGQFFLEIHAPSVAEIVGHLHSEGFETIKTEYIYNFLWPVTGRLMVNRETGETCLVVREKFLTAVGYFLPISVTGEVEQLSLFEK
ncbi:MAG: hypothetical protein M0Q93_00120 [Terrimicrobiaceae bacterium]|jgi:hypothetical protein|nr:hypothetical protein [Terrimicrobiaceae bacterium]